MTTMLRDETAAPAVGRWRYAVWLLLGLMVVAHGCHGDKDTELTLSPLSPEAGARGELR